MRLFDGLFDGLGFMGHKDRRNSPTGLVMFVGIDKEASIKWRVLGGGTFEEVVEFPVGFSALFLDGSFFILHLLLSFSREAETIDADDVRVGRPVFGIVLNIARIVGPEKTIRVVHNELLGQKSKGQALL